jgi:hypothetical protein
LKCDSGLRRNDGVGVLLVIPAKAGIAVAVAKGWRDGWLLVGELKCDDQLRC